MQFQLERKKLNISLIAFYDECLFKLDWIILLVSLWSFLFEGTKLLNLFKKNVKNTYMKEIVLGIKLTSLLEILNFQSQFFSQKSQQYF